LIELGENIKYIQRQLGHASPVVTVTLMKPVNQEASCKLENTIYSNTGSKMVAKKEKGVTGRTVTP